MNSLLVPVAAATLVALAVFGGDSFDPVFRRSREVAPGRGDKGSGAVNVAQPGERTGPVEAWHVLANGSVAVRIAGRDDKGEVFDQWFMTPGDKTETTRFEHLVLHTVLAFAASREPLTIAIESSTEKTGKTVKEAIPIQAIMWGFKPSDEQPDKKTPTTGLKR